jgi:Asp-tRNA(Asn)/Glu-tRNA(Gln) amidotransferase A subunit family amidase
MRRLTTTSTGPRTIPGMRRAVPAVRRAAKPPPVAAGLGGLGAGSDIARSLRNPAHYCGIFAHKPSWGLIPTRGHSPVGALAPTDISVVGPMARHAEDLDLATRMLAGPDGPTRTAWRVELPPPRHRRLGAFRSAVWAGSPLCEIDASVAERFEAAIAAIGAAGVAVDREARPSIDDDEHQGCAISGRDLFRRFDVLLTPVAATAAFRMTTIRTETSATFRSTASPSLMPISSSGPGSRASLICRRRQRPSGSPATACRSACRSSARKAKT